jgi:hypothetical protein
MAESRVKYGVASATARGTLRMLGERIRRGSVKLFGEKLSNARENAGDGNVKRRTAPEPP